MEKRIILIALAVFSIVILLANGNIERVYALEFVNNVLANPVGAVEHTRSGVKVFSVISELNDNIVTYSALSGAVVFSSSSWTTACETGATAGSCIGRAIVCSGSDCYINNSVTISTAKCRIMKVNTVSGAISTLYTSTITGSCSSTLGISGSNLYFVQDNGGQERLIEVAISNGAESVLVNDLGLPTGSFYCANALTLGGSVYIGVCSDGLNAYFKLVKLNTLAVCTVTGDFNANDADSDGTFAYVGLSDGTIQKITSACAISSTIASASLCGGTPVVDIDIAGTILYAVCESNAQITVFNLSTSSELAEYSCGGTITPIGDYVKVLAYSSDADSIICNSYNSNNVRIILQEGSGISGTISCVDTNLDGTTDVCFNDTNGDGIPDSGTAGNWAVVRMQQNSTQASAQIVCALGLSDLACTNPDSKTNGVGYWMLLLLIIFSLMFVYGGAHLAEYDLQSVPRELVLLVLMIDLGIAYFSGWTDQIAFFTFIFIIVAFGGVTIAQKILAKRGE